MQKPAPARGEEPVMIIHDVEQGSPEWYALRMGLPTASEFSLLMKKLKDGKDSKMRAEYMRKLAGEIITGEPMDSYGGGYRERGRILEDEARNMYALEFNASPEAIGFVTNFGTGCSPDSFVGDTKGLEIKIAVPHIQIERLDKDDLPPEHKDQVHGSMWICERDEWDFVSYCPKLPLLRVPVKRDNGYIATIKGAVDRFNDELAELVERIRRYGESVSEAA
jgi:hypothetical protein